MNNRLKYLFKNTSLFALSEITSKAINFILVPFYTFVLTTEQYGTADLVFTFASLLSPIIMFNLGEAIMRFLLDKDIDDSKVRHIEFLTIGFGILISLLIIPISSYIPGIEEYRLYLYFFVVAYAFQQVTICYLRGKEKLLAYAVCNIINTVVIAGLNILFLVFLKLGVKGYLLAYILGYAVSGIIALFAGQQFKDYVKSPLDYSLAKEMILFSLAVIPNSMLWWVINSSDRLMVSYMNGVQENGILTVAYKIPSLLTSLGFIFLQAWKYSAISEKDSSDKVEFNNKALFAFFRVLILLSSTLMILIKPIVGLLYAEAYYSSWAATSYLLYGYVFMTTGTFFGTSYYTEKKMKGNLISAFLGAVVNIIFNFAFIPKFGSAGATMAACISYITIMVYRFIDTQKFLKLKFWTIQNTALLVLSGLLLASINIEHIYSEQISIILYVLIFVINIKFILSMINGMFLLVRRSLERRW